MRWIAENTSTRDVQRRNQPQAPQSAEQFVGHVAHSELSDRHWSATSALRLPGPGVRRSNGDHEIQRGENSFEAQPKGLSDQALPAIATGSTADLPADGQAQSRPRPFALRHEHQEIPGADPSARLHHPVKVAPA